VTQFITKPAGLVINSWRSENHQKSALGFQGLMQWWNACPRLPARARCDTIRQLAGVSHSDPAPAQIRVREWHDACTICRRSRSVTTIVRHGEKGNRGVLAKNKL